LEEGGVEGFETFLGRCWKEDGVESFGNLNVKFDLFSIFKCLKRDLGIHKDFYFSLDALECISSITDLRTHTFFG